MDFPRGSQVVNRDVLDLIPVPQETKSYTPVPHGDLVDTVKTIACDLLSGFRLDNESYTIARSGNQLFATLTFKRDRSDITFCVGYRNSLDCSLAIGICLGAQVVCCSNLMFEGDSVTILKKHTKSVWVNLENILITSLYRSNKSYDILLEDAGFMRGQCMTDEDAAELTGILYFNDVLNPRMLPLVKKEWNNPSHPEHGKDTLWSYMMASTEALKIAPPSNRMEKTIALHKYVTAGKDTADTPIDMTKTVVNGVEQWDVTTV